MKGGKSALMEGVKGEVSTDGGGGGEGGEVSTDGGGGGVKGGSQH